MPNINQLNAVDTPSGSDLLPIYSQQNGDARKLSITNLVNYIKQSFSPATFFTQYSVPSATGFNVQVNDSSSNVWLILSPLGSYAAGTITLPAVANCVDGQEVLVNCAQAVTTLTVNGNGAVDVLGEPTTLAANAFFRLRYQALTRIWYRVG